MIKQVNRNFTSCQCDLIWTVFEKFGDKFSYKVAQMFDERWSFFLIKICCANFLGNFWGKLGNFREKNIAYIKSHCLLCKTAAVFEKMITDRMIHLDFLPMTDIQIFGKL